MELYTCKGPSGFLTLKIDQMKAKEINKVSLGFDHYVHYVYLYMCQIKKGVILEWVCVALRLLDSQNKNYGTKRCCPI